MDSKPPLPKIPAIVIGERPRSNSAKVSPRNLELRMRHDAAVAFNRGNLRKAAVLRKRCSLEATPEEVEAELREGASTSDADVPAPRPASAGASSAPSPPPPKLVVSTAGAAPSSSAAGPTACASTSTTEATSALQQHRREPITAAFEQEEIARQLKTIKESSSEDPPPAAAPSASPAVPLSPQSQSRQKRPVSPRQQFRSMSTEAKSEEMKRRLGGFYGQLASRVIAHIFWFDAFIGASPPGRKRLMQVNLATGHITRFTRLRKKKKEQWAFSALLQAVRSDSDPELITLRMRDGSSTSFRLASMAERERFYGLCWLGQCNNLATGGTVPASEEINIFVGTWNMAGNAPKQPPELWLRPNAYDVCVVCAQECTQESLFHKLTGHLENTYVKLDFASILYVKLAVFVHRQHVAKIRFVERTDVALGIGNVIGNKGAVAIAFQFNETSFCFIGCHLAAHEKNLEQRNRQYSAIVKALKMGMPRCDVLNQFDHVIWCGDFNYRITASQEEALTLIEHKNLPKLLMTDQLLVSRAKSEVFLDHTEGPITFPPTFKLGDNCHRYDRQRTPSWCDRILWKSAPSSPQMRLVEYGCSEILTSSDHRPVFGVFRTIVLLPPNPARTVPLAIVFHGPVSATGLALISEDGDKGDGIEPDPVLVFRAPFLNQQLTYHSKVKKRTCDPVWAEGDIKDIVTCISDPEFLSHQHLTVFVIHIDRESRQVLLGQCIIPLGLSSPTPFSTRITLEGKHAGVLSGRVCVIPTGR